MNLKNVHSKGDQHDPQVLNNDKKQEAKSQLVCKLIDYIVKLFN